MHAAMCVCLSDNLYKIYLIRYNREELQRRTVFIHYTVISCREMETNTVASGALYLCIVQVAAYIVLR